MATPNRPRSVPPAVLAAALYAIVFGSVFAGVVTARETIVHGDALSVSLPLQSLFVRHLAEGGIPLWSSHVYGGHPVFAEGQGAYAHPLTWLVFGPLALYTNGTDPDGRVSAALLHAHGVFHLLCVWIAALGTFGLARSFGIGVVASLFSGFVLGGSQGWLFLTSNATIAGAAAWVPWLLFATQRMWEHPSPTRAVSWSLAFALVALAGYPQALHAALLFALIVSLVRSERSTLERAGPLVTNGLLALVLGLGLSAIQWLPTLELVAASVRADGIALAYSHTFAELLRGVLVSMSGNAVLQPGLGSLLAFALVLFALLAARPTRQVVAIAIATLFLFLLGMGDNSLLYRALRPALPGLDGFRIVWMYPTVATIGLALLGGFGLEALSRLKTLDRNLVARGIGIAGAVGLLGWWIALPGISKTNVAFLSIFFGAAATAIDLGRARFLGPIAVALCVVEIFVLRAPLFDFADFETFRRPPPSIVALRERQITRLGFETLNLPHTHTAITFAAPDAANLEALATRLLASIGESSNLIWPVPSIGANLALPLARRAQLDERIRAESRGLSPRPAGTRWIDQIGLRYYVFDWESKDVPHAADFRKIVSVPDHPFWIRENPNARPFFQLRSAAPVRWVADWHEAVRHFEGVDPATLVLEGPAPVETARMPEEGTFAGAIGRSRIGLGNYEAQVRLDKPGYLFIADAPYPGWNATLDGEPVPVLAANVLGKAVAVPAGLHHVELRFEPTSVRVGSIASAVTLVSVLLLVWRNRSAR